MRVKIITKSIEGFGWCSISLLISLHSWKAFNIYTFMPLKEENKKKPTPNAIESTYGLLPTVFPLDLNLFFFCFNSFCLVSSILFLLLLTHTRQVDNDSDKTGCDDHGISRVSLTRLFILLDCLSPLLPLLLLLLPLLRSVWRALAW